MSREIKSREAMKNKYKAVYVAECWVVFGPFATEYAEFSGKHAGQYAREHAKRLNELPEEEQP